MGSSDIGITNVGPSMLADVVATGLACTVIVPNAKMTQERFVGILQKHCKFYYGIYYAKDNESYFRLKDELKQAGAILSM